MKRQTLSLSVAISSVLWLGACSTGGPSTIGSLRYEPPARDMRAPDAASHAQVRADYAELIELVEDQRLKEQIERRIADVYMMEGGHDQVQEAAGGGYYLEAIRAYQNILERYPDSPDNAEVLYQLARAYDLEGEQEQAKVHLEQLTQRHPHYDNLAEAHFRLGDIYFSRGEYPRAERSYQAVLTLDDSRFDTNARYMLGWSLYKQTQFHASIEAFSEVLKGLMGTDSEFEALDDARQPVARDAVHSIGLALDNLGGAEVIELFDDLAHAPYGWLIYDNLGEFYREKDLYERAADSFRQYVERFPHSPRAPQLHEKIIETYVDGGFPRLVLEEKSAYVQAYGVRSDYPGNVDGLAQQVQAPLRAYLDELARYHYNVGRELDEAPEEDRPALADGSELAERDAPTEIEPEALEAYGRAADYYAQYAESFPRDDRIDEVIFLRAEALFLARQYDQAVAGYERVAYNPYGDSALQHGSNAGYAAIIAYQEHIASLVEEDSARTQWQTQAVESMLRFAAHYHDDERAVPVLTNASEYLFGLGEYRQALAVTQALIDDNPSLDPALQKTVYGIMAHSHFNLSEYDRAAERYDQQRELMMPDDEDYQRVSERMANALYRHFEALESGGAETEQTIEQLLSIKTRTPDANLRVPAQYEAVTLLISLEAWDRALVELDELLSDHAGHELAVSFARRKAYVHEQAEHWQEAGDQYLHLADNDPDEDTRREALFLAATMYENAERYEQAINHFRRYANTYELPADTLMEAKYKLAVNYERVADGERQRFWLDRLVTGAQRDPGNERNQWLSAWANDKYGDYHAERFRRYSLAQPLASSLGEKTARLDQAARRYQQSADQGVFEFTTRSSYKIAELYRDLAQALRAAPAPGGLSSSDLALYRDIIEEQALPFEDLALELHQVNIERAWGGQFNPWIDRSFEAMRTLSPVRFNKTEQLASYGDEIR